MPTISVFFGIVIRMYFDEHNPPHFHAHYAENEAIVDIETMQVRAGSLPRRALALVLEWASEHREELAENWLRAERHEPLLPIAPLE